MRHSTLSVASALAPSPTPSRLVRGIVYCAAALVAGAALLAVSSLLAARRSVDNQTTPSADPASRQWVFHSGKHEW